MKAVRNLVGETLPRAWLVGRPESGGAVAGGRKNVPMAAKWDKMCTGTKDLKKRICITGVQVEKAVEK